METMEYEMARNMTLLFFLERLLDKGEPRTLHDLSCQFGAKGFTREMRQIAGGSQSGKKIGEGVEFRSKQKQGQGKGTIPRHLPRETYTDCAHIKFCKGNEIRVVV